jgi:esterase/lipase superfamily enzyme
MLAKACTHALKMIENQPTNLTRIRHLGARLLVLLALALASCLPQKAAVGQPEADRDHDGVADARDKCPDVPGGTSSDGCPPVVVGATPPASRGEKLPANDKRQVTVFFCTTRNQVRENGELGFGKAAAAPSYGACRVSIPRDHRLGEVEVPLSVFGFDIEKPDPDRHMVVLKTQLSSQRELLDWMNRKTDESPNKDAFVFVHGFNNTFNEALLRTAQFTYDLGFRGAPLLFSWPSQGSYTLTGYRTDEQMNKGAVAPFKAFLRTYLQSSTAQNIYLIAHSMGNRIMISTLQELMLESPALFANRHVREIVLTAPDIGVKDFKEKLAPVIKSGKSNITLYASDDDKALTLSRLIHNNEARAGQGGAGLVVLPGIETIDATGVSTDFLGHSYFASESSVVSDLYYLFLKSERAEKRKWLTKMVGQPYWTFRRNLGAP